MTFRSSSHQLCACVKPVSPSNDRKKRGEGGGGGGGGGECDEINHSGLKPVRPF